jgi:predicted O-methyltransferase YrrM
VRARRGSPDPEEEEASMVDRWASVTTFAALSGVAAALFVVATARAAADDAATDARVRAFLEKSRGSWRDWNVPEEDGRILHDLVLKRRFRSALEIGTSTGHSSIWIAWALSKTNGRLTTIEIDPGRHAAAVRNFKEAGVDGLVDARLADAHALVKQLPGPFDFVFSDADKDWYLQYFKDLEPKIAPGGCFTAHNVLRSGGGGAAEFLEYVKKLPAYETTVETGGGEGISISCKRR